MVEISTKLPREIFNLSGDICKVSRQGHCQSSLSPSALPESLTLSGHTYFRPPPLPPPPSSPWATRFGLVSTLIPFARPPAHFQCCQVQTGNISDVPHIAKSIGIVHICPCWYLVGVEIRSIQVTLLIGWVHITIRYFVRLSLTLDDGRSSVRQR